MLGDSVVNVKHCMDPHGGKITSRTWALLATGGVSVLVSAIAFYVSVSTAAYNKAGLQYWTQVAHKPAYSYRAHMLSTGWDWLAFGGFAIGLIAIAGALLRMRDERKSPYYRIGTAPGVEQPLEGAPTADFPLVAPQGDEFVFNFARNMTGEAIIANRATPFAELVANGSARPSTSLPGAFELPLATHPRIRAKVGQTSFVVSAVPQPRRQPTPLFAGMQSRTMSYFAGSLAVHLGLVLLLSFIPVEAGGASWDIAQSEMTYVKVTGEMKEDPALEEPEAVADGDGGPTAAGQAMALEAGQAGDPSKQKVASSHIRIKDNQLDPQLARIQAIEEARTAGVLGSIALQSGDAFASLEAQNNVSSGFDPVNAYGAIYGADGEGYGTFGYSRNGFGKGGGCDASKGPCGGIIGSSYGQLGLGRFGNSGWNTSDGGIPGGRKHKAGVPDPVIGRPETVGDLDKEIIRRHIKRNVEKIKYCYEKQLLANPSLQGNVTVTFFITPAGNVTSSVGRGMNTETANCIAEVVGAIQFPKPANGGVQVNYPFTFHSTAGQ